MPLKDIFHRKDKHSSTTVEANGTTTNGLKNTQAKNGHGRKLLKSSTLKDPVTEVNKAKSKLPAARPRSSTMGHNPAFAKPLPSVDTVKRKPVLVYNPYGINSMNGNGNGGSGGGGFGSSGIGSNAVGTQAHASTLVMTNNGTHVNTTRTTSHHNSFSFNALDLDNDKPNLLPLPLESPNEHLPEDLQQEFEDLYPTYQIPSSDSKNRSLGDGASAQVRTIQRKSDRKIFALKRFTLFKNETPSSFYARCSKEFIISKKLTNNLHIVDTFELVKIPSVGHLQRGWGFVLEYCSGGDLFSLIQKHGWKSYANETKFCIFKQVVEAIKFMHEKDIAHRDIKPENILLNERGIVKVTDFGVSTTCHSTPGDLQSELQLSSAFVGSPPYVPPEVMNVKGKKKNAVKYNPFKMDHWSLGMLLFCLVYQGTPFQEAGNWDSKYRDFVSTYSQFVARNPSFKKDVKTKGPGVEYKYGQGFKDSGASRAAWRLCDPDPNSRYTFDELYADRWFKEVEVCCFLDDENHLVCLKKHHHVDVPVY